MSQSENIEKLFYNEVRDKKRIGSNIFSRVSTRKGGTNQALRTPYYFMSSKEKNNLNGKVIKINMSEEIVPLETLEEFDTETQKRVMERWRDNFPVKDIIDKMGLNKSQYYEKIHELGIERKKMGGQAFEIIRATEEEFNHMKNNIVDYKRYKSLPKDQKMELIIHYHKSLSSKEIAELWDTNIGNVYSYKSQANRYFSENKNKEVFGNKSDNNDITAKEEVKEELRSEELRSQIIETTQKATQSEHIQNQLFIEINKRGNSEYIAKKIQSIINLIDLIDDEDGDFELELKLSKVKYR